MILVFAPERGPDVVADHVENLSVPCELFSMYLPIAAAAISGMCSCSAMACTSWSLNPHKGDHRG
jgi:hypothetical protein